MAEGYNAVERARRILEHLRKNTDEEHRVSQKELKKALERYFKKQRHDQERCFRMAQAVNSNKDEQLLPSKDWKIIYEAFCDRYDESRQMNGEHPGTDYIFLHDSFGDTFRYERTEPPYGDIVQEASGSFAIVNWTLQYAGRVEVLEPKEVREKVKEKLRTLNQRYGLDE